MYSVAPTGILLGEEAGLCAAVVGEEDHLGQFVEKLDGSSRQLRQTPDGCGMNLLTKFQTDRTWTFKRDSIYFNGHVF